MRKATIFFFLFSEMTNPKTGSFEIRKAQRFPVLGLLNFGRSSKQKVNLK